MKNETIRKPNLEKKRTMLRMSSYMLNSPKTIYVPKEYCEFCLSNPKKSETSCAKCKKSFCLNCFKKFHIPHPKNILLKLPSKSLMTDHSIVCKKVENTKKFIETCKSLDPLSTNNLKDEIIKISETHETLKKMQTFYDPSPNKISYKKNKKAENLNNINDNLKEEFNILVKETENKIKAIKNDAIKFMVNGIY